MLFVEKKKQKCAFTPNILIYEKNTFARNIAGVISGLTFTLSMSDSHTQITPCLVTYIYRTLDFREKKFV